MNNESFKEKFLLNMESLPTSSSIFEENIYRNDKNIDYICYVEGPTDSDFYGNISNTSISSKNIRFIRSLISGESENKLDIGKEGVIKNYFRVLSKEALKKSIFIIDHDYDGLISDFYSLDELNDKYFSITDGYAFENYFLTSDNIKRIFDYFKLSIEEYYNFESYLKKFIEDVSNYNRLKSCTVIACKNCKYHTKLPSTSVRFMYGRNTGKKIEANDIFKFDFTNKYEYYFRKNLMEMQNKRIEYVIRNNSLIMDYYNNVSNRIDNNLMYIRGHDLYSFLQQYLYQMFNINISPRLKDRQYSHYIDIVKILDIKMKFVNGLGETIV